MSRYEFWTLTLPQRFSRSESDRFGFATTLPIEFVWWRVRVWQNEEFGAQEVKILEMRSFSGHPELMQRLHSRLYLE